MSASSPAPHCVAPHLWTRDFTIITLGSVVSMVGNAISGFAISILVLDYTQSTFLYTLFLVCTNLPKVAAPLLAGPLVDRFSRKRIIYTLDYTSAALYLAIFFVLRAGWFRTGAFMCVCLVIGTIDGMYAVAYESLYPNLISDGCHRKAYSISSMIYPVAQCMVPVASLVYAAAGSVTPLFLANSICFFTAATFETRIGHVERHTAHGAMSLAQYKSDLAGGVEYLKGEPGLRAITLLFVLVSFSIFGSDAMILPFFKNHAALFAHIAIPVVTLYSVVHSCNVLGRLAGGLVHYTLRYPEDKRFAISVAVYITTPVLSMLLLFLPVPAMMVCFFVSGMLSVTSYTIRITATQNYVPDEKRGRFNGIFNMSSSLGVLLGQLTAGLLSTALSERAATLVFGAVNLAAVFLLVLPRAQHFRRIYNRKV